MFLSPADKLVGRLILGLQRRNVSEGLILLNLSSDHFIFYPRSRILQQKCLVAFFFLSYFVVVVSSAFSHPPRVGFSFLITCCVVVFHGDC